MLVIALVSGYVGAMEVVYLGTFLVKRVLRRISAGHYRSPALRICGPVQLFVCRISEKMQEGKLYLLTGVRLGLALPFFPGPFTFALAPSREW